MSLNNTKSRPWIKIKTKRKQDNVPSEIEIDMDGKVYIDGESYDAANVEYKNLTVDVENYNRLNAGEETDKIIEASKKVKKGEEVTIKDVESSDKKESTTVKF